MTKEENELILEAIRMIEAGAVNRVEGKGWLVYRVGKIIRVDIKE
jgi:hypothetical protein